MESSKPTHPLMRRGAWSPRVRVPGSPSVLTDVTLEDGPWQNLHHPPGSPRSESVFAV